MNPSWDLPDPFTEMLLKHQSLGSAALTLPALILGGLLMSGIWPRLLDKGHLKRKVTTVLHKAAQFLARQSPYLPIAVVAGVFVGFAPAPRPHCAGQLNTLLSDFTSPIAKVLSLITTMVGSGMLVFANTGAGRMQARILLAFGIAVAAVNISTIAP